MTTQVSALYSYTARASTLALAVLTGRTDKLQRRFPLGLQTTHYQRCRKIGESVLVFGANT